MLMSTLAPVWCGGLVKTTRVVNMSINVAVIPPWRLPERFRWPSSIFILNEAFPSSHDRSSTYKRHRTKCISTGIPSLKWVILCTLQWPCYSTAKLYGFVCKKCSFLGVFTWIPRKDFFLYKFFQFGKLLDNNDIAILSLGLLCWSIWMSTSTQCPNNLVKTGLLPLPSEINSHKFKL